MENPPPPRTTRRRWGRWLALVLIAGVGVMVALTAIRWHNQLDMKRLQEARARWEKNRPAHYDLKYTTRRSGATQPDRFEVKVRAGKVVGVDFNGKPEKADRFHYRDMGRLFDFIEKFLDLDHDTKTGGKKAAAWADFDPVDGHLLHYRRQVLAGSEGVEIVVESLTRPEQ